MPLDPERVAETRSWFQKAAEDLRAAEFELGAEPPLTTDILFHAQQAAEKSMKGFLAWLDRPFGKTHNLVVLGELCAAIEPALESLMQRAAPLTEYAWKFRYPGEPEEPTDADARSALAIADEVHRAILSFLPDQVRP